MDWDAWGGDVLSADAKAARTPAPPTRVEAARELVVERHDGYVGAVVRVEAGNVHLEDRRGAVRAFPLGRGFFIDGVEVELVPAVAKQAGSTRTASGSRAVGGLRARVALPSRILVEGVHDAELVEQVWGHDLRVEGVVVEPLHGADDLAAIVAEFAPTRERRLGILLDHLVPGSKESRIAAAVTSGPHGAHVRIVGHPFIDIWQAVKPARLGIAAWPAVPKGEDWKRGTLQRLGMPHGSQEDVGRAWQRIRSRVRDWNDLEPELLGRVEELIDFVTAASSPPAG
ncbi:DUF3097 domain-containing protein [Agrococcus sp. ARC_14]|uniref:DUF3097 domain-containing protein n=1 Tax=Agrococcus sp. ARC_14 TaxID=2919927 RepID=UPI001F0647A8|nr:DUF3097 domain-containing protein [Agrococcus sp. ARC_14]MCH1882804.1 DUF3097 domain-containing protein [Agrococcus sp. ARC_14]